MTVSYLSSSISASTIEPLHTSVPSLKPRSVNTGTLQINQTDFQQQIYSSLKRNRISADL